jgi:hypothetical protein
MNTYLRAIAAILLVGWVERASTAARFWSRLELLKKLWKHAWAPHRHIIVIIKIIIITAVMPLAGGLGGPIIVNPILTRGQIMPTALLLAHPDLKNLTASLNLARMYSCLFLRHHLFIGLQQQHSNKGEQVRSPTHSSLHSTQWGQIFFQAVLKLGPFEMFWSLTCFCPMVLQCFAALR